ncbi:hypothetical protein AB0M35_20335 [Micromonospora sp. NPDC051196]|uniref:hypothetical protein n=1 Tax=Micromonospora sp. NPDC051196 TaxID=3155281 RepID=UPI003414F365
MVPAAVVAAWESVRSVPAAARPAALLRAFGQPPQPSVGRREAALLAVYVEHFGVRLDGLARCPRCATDVELSVPVVELTSAMPPAAPVEPLVSGEVSVDWRLPHDDDLAACVGAPDGATLLLQRCAPSCPPSLRAELAARIAAADPYADITFELVCPQCACAWEAALAAAEFVWAQLRAHAQRLLREVDELARAYGWSEQQIFALSQQRRDSYLELVRGG